MKITHSLFPTALLFILIFCIACGKKHTAPSSDALRPVSEQEAMETQRNVNRYFHSDVIPKLQDGWKELRDTAKYVTYHYTFIKN